MDGRTETGEVERGKTVNERGALAFMLRDPGEGLEPDQKK
jgi:hypothetical protein